MSWWLSPPFTIYKRLYQASIRPFMQTIIPVVYVSPASAHYGNTSLTRVPPRVTLLNPPGLSWWQVCTTPDRIGNNFLTWTSSLSQVNATWQAGQGGCRGDDPGYSIRLTPGLVAPCACLRWWQPASIYHMQGFSGHSNSSVSSWNAPRGFRVGWLCSPGVFNHKWIPIGPF